MWFMNYSREKMGDNDMAAAQLVLYSLAPVLRQDSGVRWAGIAGDERVDCHIRVKKNLQIMSHVPILAQVFLFCFWRGLGKEWS